WGNAISAMVAGGGLKGGMVVGATNAKAEHPVERALKPGHLLATIYHVLGIDPSLSFNDHTGRPIPILSEGEPIYQLLYAARQPTTAALSTTVWRYRSPVAAW